MLDSRDPPSSAISTPRSSGTGISNEARNGEKSFGELLIECDVYPHDKSMFINYDRVSRMCGEEGAVGVMVAALQEEMEKVHDFTEQRVEDLEGKVQRMMALVPDGTRLGQLASQQARNQTTGSAVWRWFSAKIKGRSSAVTTGEVERCYLAVHEHMRYLRMNGEAVARLSSKIRLTVPNQEITGVANVPSQTFEKQEHRFRKLLSDLESIYPVEDLPQLRVLGETQGQPGDEKTIFSTVVGQSFLYYSIVIALTLPILFWAYTSETHRMRCLCMLCLLLLLNLSQAVPLFCTAMAVPFCCVLFRVFPEENLVKVSTELVSVMFSPLIFVILVMLTINVIMIKCQMELRFANLLARTSVSIHSPMFLLLLMVGTMMMAAFSSAGLLMMGAIVPRLRDLPEQRRSTAKCILLGIMMSANVGGALLPLSSAQALIAISALREFNTDISLLSWVLFAVPICVITTLGLWVIILFLIGLPRKSDEGNGAATTDSYIVKVPPFSWMQLFFIGLSAALLISMIFNSFIDKYCGGIVVLAFLFLFICYGSGFCTTTDFNNLNWDLVMCLAGSNALNHAMRMSGLATWLSAQLLTQQDIVGDYIWLNAAKITAFVMVMATFFGQATAGIIFLPFVLPLAVALYAPETVALMCVVGITCSMAFPFSTSDNYVIATAARDDFRRRYLSFSDVVKVGMPGTILSYVLLITLGYFIAISHYGLPPKHILKSTPDTLRQSIKPWNEQEALEARLEAIENRYNALEKRSGIHLNRKEDPDSFLSMNEAAWQMSLGSRVHPEGVGGKSDSDSFLSIKSFGHLDTSHPKLQTNVAMKTGDEKATREISKPVLTNHVQVRNQSTVHAPQENGYVKVKPGLHMPLPERSKPTSKRHKVLDKQS